MSSKVKRRSRRKQIKRFGEASKWSDMAARRRTRPARVWTEDGPLEISEFEVVFKPMDDHDEEWDRFVAAESEAWDRIEADMFDAIYRHVDELERLVQAYPQTKQLYTYLASAYAKSGRADDADDLTRLMYELFPEYLFARTNYALLCLHEGRIEEVPAIMKDEPALDRFAPGRRRFHVTEVMAFHGVWAMYWHEIGMDEQAAQVYEMLAQLAPDHPMVTQLGFRLLPRRQKLASAFRRLTGMGK